jgi:hypothetical protein
LPRASRTLLVFLFFCVGAGTPATSTPSPNDVTVDVAVPSKEWNLSTHAAFQISLRCYCAQPCAFDGRQVVVWPRDWKDFSEFARCPTTKESDEGWDMGWPPKGYDFVALTYEDLDDAGAYMHFPGVPDIPDDGPLLRIPPMILASGRVSTQPIDLDWGEHHQARTIKIRAFLWVNGAQVAKSDPVVIHVLGGDK